MLTGKVVVITDILEDRDYTLPANELNRTRSLLAAPLLRNDRVDGVLVIARTEPGAFNPRQIELVQTFADQAVIAIENARLFEEVQARTKDLQEALQQQTATADVLKVISRSAFDLQVVFDTLLTSAVRFAAAQPAACASATGACSRTAPIGASVQVSLSICWRTPPAGQGVDGRSVLGQARSCAFRMFSKLRNTPCPPCGRVRQWRSTLGVPLLRDNRVEGALVLVRLEPGTFQQRQIDTVKTFADQASSRSRMPGCSMRCRRARRSSPPRSTTCARRRTG